MTAVDIAARNVITLAIALTAVVDRYNAYGTDARAVRAAGLAVNIAHRNMLHTPGDLNDPDTYLEARRRARICSRTVANIVADAIAGIDNRHIPLIAGRV